MIHWKYGLDAGEMKMDDLARALTSALQIPLYRCNSPMIGPWYSSTDFAQLAKAMKAGDQQTLKRLALESETDPRPNLTLTLNDPEPGYLALEYELGGTHILELKVADSAAAQALDQALRSLPIPVRRLSSGD